MFRLTLSRGLSLLFSGFLVLLFIQPVLAATEVRYTKYNIHAQSKDTVNLKASYANYTNPGVGHIIIPAGTKIKVTKYGWRGFVFTYDNGNKKVSFEFHKKRMGMSMEEYVKLITSAKPVKYSGLSKLDRKGVANGNVFNGMTRKGVMIALGYPAAHRTPSLESNTWIYWGNRFRTRAIEFNDHGKVSAVK